MNTFIMITGRVQSFIIYIPSIISRPDEYHTTTTTTFAVLLHQIANKKLMLLNLSFLCLHAIKSSTALVLSNLMIILALKCVTQYQCLMMPNETHVLNKTFFPKKNDLAWERTTDERIDMKCNLNFDCCIAILEIVLNNP